MWAACFFVSNKGNNTICDFKSDYENAEFYLTLAG